MPFNPNQSVSLEEYNATLRNTVNAYYEHAINDPSMSKEEAIQSTAEVSERYLDNVQEFQAFQGLQTGASIGVNEEIQDESTDIETDTSAVDTTVVSAADISSEEAEVSSGGIGDDDSSGGVDCDDDGIDGGMDA